MNYSKKQSASFICLFLFISQTALFAQSKLVNIEVTDKNHFQIIRYEGISIPYSNAEISIPYIIVLENSEKDGSKVIPKEGVLRYSLTDMNSKSTIRVKLQSVTVKNIRNNLFSSLIGDIILIASLQKVVGITLSPDSDSSLGNQKNSYSKTKQRLKKFIRDEIKDELQELLNRQIDETFDIIDKWESMLVASNGVNNDYYKYFKPINVYKMVKKSGIKKSGINPKWFFDIGPSLYKKDLGNRWNQSTSGINNLSLEFLFARNIASINLGNQTSLGLYGFLGYQVYKHELNNDLMDVYISGENVQGTEDDFVPIVSNEGIVLWNSQARVGSIIQLYKYNSFFGEVGAGWNFSQRGTIKLDDLDSDSQSARHVNIGLSPTSDSFKNVVDYSSNIYGLIRFGYTHLSKDKSDRNYGVRIFISAQFWSNDLTSNQENPLFQRNINTDGSESFEPVSIDEGNGLFYILGAGAGFVF